MSLLARAELEELPTLPPRLLVVDSDVLRCVSNAGIECGSIARESRLSRRCEQGGEETHTSGQEFHRLLWAVERKGGRPFEEGEGPSP